MVNKVTILTYAVLRCCKTERAVKVSWSISYKEHENAVILQIKLWPMR